jgi:hypothetical protein
MKNRIKEHRKVRVGDLVPHELNPRIHNGAQRDALQALLGEIGFARSVLAYELPDGRLKLIDGHLRQTEIDPDELIDVEVLDVNDEEARKLLLSLDPLAMLADYDNRVVDELRKITETDNLMLEALWATIRKQDEEVREQLEEISKRDKEQALPEQYLVLIECASEKEQTEMLARFKKQGLKCKALMS